jgi:glycerol-1-phosphate dehydrogenase [NAD(P)+]
VTPKEIQRRVGRKKPGQEESAWIVVKALISSGVAMSIAGSSRPASGAEHLFSYQLDRLVPGAALDGEQVGVGSIIAAYLHDGEDGMWRDIRDALAKIGASTTADELGINQGTVIEALTTAHNIRDRYTILGNGMSEKVARNRCYLGVCIQILHLPVYDGEPVVDIRPISHSGSTS